MMRIKILITEIIDYRDLGIKPNSATTVDSTSQTELVRDDVRQEANLTLVQDSLTTQQDSVMPDEVVLSPKGDTFRWSQPKFEEVLSRWYKIATPSWAHSASQDTQILSLDVSKTLFNIVTLFDRIKRFRYWRGGVKVRLQVNSTPFHYGSLYAAIIPYLSSSEAVAEPPEPSTWYLSGQACSGNLSANTGKPLELYCPFQCPNEYLHITKLDDYCPFKLLVCVMNPLKVAGGASNPTLQLSVFAQFTDLELLGPSEITANSSSKKINKADTEQRNATKQGTLGKVAGAVSDVAGKLSTIPVIGGVASAVAPVAKAIGGIFDFFGWDKPTDMSSTSFMTIRNGRGMTNASGMDSSDPIGLKPDQKVSTEASNFGYDDQATRSLLKLIQTPMWNGSFTIANNQVTESVFKIFYVRPFAPDVTYDVPAEIEYQRHAYLSYYSQFFKSCRGGYRYIFHFDTSSYTTARIRVTFDPSTETVSSVTDGGDSFSRIIDINGSTTVVLEVPYCYPSARMPIEYGITKNFAANGQLLFSLVNPIQTNGSSSDVIFVNVFRCAADDFRFYQPREFQKHKTYQVSLAKKNLIRPNSLLEKIGEATITTLGDGPKVSFDRITEDEEVWSHNDFLHRYHVAYSSSSANIQLYPHDGDPYYWMTPFRAYRGAIRLCSHPFTTLHDGLVLDNNSTITGVVAAGTNFSGLTANDLPFEVPYNNNIRFLPIRMDSANYMDGYSRLVHIANSSDHQVLWSAGDDFTLGLRKAPAILGISLAPP